MFEVRWNRPFATNFFGQFVQSRGLIQVPASLAIQLHEENAGWVCARITEAKAFLVAENTIFDGIPVSIDEVSPAGAPVTGNLIGTTVESELAAEQPADKTQLVCPPEDAIITPTPHARPASPAVNAAKAEAAKARRSQKQQK